MTVQQHILSAVRILYHIQAALLRGNLFLSLGSFAGNGSNINIIAGGHRSGDMLRQKRTNLH